MKSKNKGYVVPVAIGVLALASLGLLFFSWSNTPSKNDDSKNTESAMSRPVMNDDATLEDDSANIDAQIKALDNSSADVDTSFKDTSSI